MKTAREIALLTLSACEQEQAWAGAYLQRAMEQEKLDARERALALRLCYGVLQNRGLLDYLLTPFCSMPLRKLEPKMLQVLRLGGYQLLFLDKIPVRAAVNESVELARKYAKNPRAPGLVNGVLRTLDRSRNQLPPLPQAALSRLSIQYSHPEWLVKELCSLLGETETEAFLKANNQEAPIALQINRLHTTLEAVQKKLTEQGADVQVHPWLPDCLLLRRAGNLERLSGFETGDFWVQDPAARLAVLAAAPQAGARVLDACSAPGGKSFAAGVELQNQGEILACDIHGRKLKLVEQGAKRLGCSILQTREQDAGVFCPEWEAGFDLVIADLPCSGMGVIRKKPDIRYHAPEPMERLPAVQSRLLACLCRYVKPGGTLLYSTCTVLKRENEDVVSAFLAEHPAFALEPFSLPCPGGESKGMLTLWPQRQDTDGFFMARLRRSEYGTN